MAFILRIWNFWQVNTKKLLDKLPERQLHRREGPGLMVIRRRDTGTD